MLPWHYIGSRFVAASSAFLLLPILWPVVECRTVLPFQHKASVHPACKHAEPTEQSAAGETRR